MNFTGIHSGNFVAKQNPGNVPRNLLIKLDFLRGCGPDGALMKKGLRLWKVATRVKLRCPDGALMKKGLRPARNIDIINLSGPDGALMKKGLRRQY